MSVSLIATACPAVQTFGPMILKSAVYGGTASPPVSYTVPQPGGVNSAPLNANAWSSDMVGRYGGGLIGIGRGLVVTAGTALSVSVSAGDAMIDGPVQIGAATVVGGLPDATAKIWVWLKQNGTLQAVPTSLTPPSGMCCLLACVQTAGGVVISVDTSCVMYLRGGKGFRASADPGVPLDSPPAGVSFFHNTPFGAFEWDGASYQQRGVPSVTAHPTNAYEGLEWYRSDLSQMYIYSGGSPHVVGVGGAPTGSAGGDLTGTYPNPTLAAAGPGATGPIGDPTHVPVITIDSKGRVIALTSASITGGGTVGTKIYAGAGPPAGGLGVDGDFYFNTTNGDYYTKASGAWGSPQANLTGPTGPTGPPGSGTVNSVALAAPGIFNVTGSPVTNAGTLTLALVNQSANLVWAGPGSGGAAAPTFRSLVAADLPSSGVTAGSYTSANITVDAKGRVTAAANGSGGSGGGGAIAANALTINAGGSTIAYVTPTTVTELFSTGPSNTGINRSKFDLTHCTQARLMISNPNVSPAVKPLLLAQYYNGSTWVPLDGSSGPSLTFDANFIDSGWVTIDSAAIALGDVPLRVVASVASGSSTHNYGSIILQVK